MMKVTLLVLFGVFLVHGNGCSQLAFVNSTVFGQLASTLRGISNEITRESTLYASVANYTQGFDGNQTTTLLSLFTNTITKKNIIKKLSPLILGINCKDTVAILRLVPNEILQLEVLVFLANLTIDLRVNNQTILAVFNNVFNKRDALAIITAAIPRSCIWGDISVKRLIFLVDTSGSMATTFVGGDGKTYTRLGFVANQLEAIISGSLSPDQEFNIITFSDRPNQWSPGVVPVTASNVASALSYVKKLTAIGGTSMLAGLKAAFSDPKAMAVYLLTDGQPSDATPAAILDAARKWSIASKGPVNAISFQAGGTYDPNAALFMSQLAAVTGGIYKNIT